MNKLLCFILLFSPLLGWADSERMPSPHVFPSPSNRYYLKLVPDVSFDPINAKGYVYQVTSSEDELLYKFSGWYSFSVLLSSGGEFIARLGPWPRIGIPPSETIAVAFYSNGELIKEHFVSDLIENPSELPTSVSHYDWGGNLEWSDSPWNNIVQVTTNEGNIIKFNMETGEIQ